MAIKVEIRKAAVAAVNAGHSKASVARHYGIDREHITKWMNNPEKFLRSDEEKFGAIGEPESHHSVKFRKVPIGISSIEEQGLSGDIVLAIPDLHCPFEHKDALDFLKAVRDKYQTKSVVCLGDEIDAHAYSRWPKDPNGMSAGHELQAAIEHLIPFYLAFPNVQVCISNHTIRPKKLMKDMGLPTAFWPKYETMLHAPDGWTWHEHIIIDNVRYMHGDQGKGGMNGWTKNSEVYHQSTVVGHWHSKAGVYYDSAMFNVNAGCLIDDKAYAFDYAKNSHKRPNLGCAVITHGKVAHFIPMVLNSENRWVGHL